MTMYLLKDHREERAHARVAQFRLLSALVAVTALTIFFPPGSNPGSTYRTVAVGLNDALFHSHSMQ